MDRLQEHLIRAARQLGMEVLAPYEVLLESGRRIVAEVLLPQLGAPKGMVVVQSWSTIQDVAAQLVQAGYGYSCMSEPHANEEFDIAGYVEFFRDWGWSSGAGDCPEWAREGSGDG